MLLTGGLHALRRLGGAALCSILLLSASATAFATGGADIVGTWDMVHDDWSGVLEISPSDQHQQAVDGNCTFSYYVLSGKWTDPQGVSHPMTGVFQGRDPNVQSGDACAQSSHMLNFAIEFGNQEPAQQFYGYVFTHQNRRMAAFTWWHGLPFGWFATKR